MAYSIYTLGVPNEWPRRLLHIPSMTSREWKPGNIYGQDKEPSYGILSYTWGRYELPEGPRLDISGIDWKIPSIDESHFRVADLERLLQQIGFRDEYAWIDIACIDQKREKAYVWLNGLEPHTIRQDMQTLMRCTNNFVCGSIGALQAFEEMADPLLNILRDRWFSSLWTLQESVLHRHAVLLDKRGEPITTHGPWTGESPNTELLDVSGACVIAKMLINQAMQAEQGASHKNALSAKLARLHFLRRTIDEAGIDFMLCANPNIQYAAARFRQTTHPEDRIYAIMQVYGYRLGNSSTSIRRTEDFSLEALELQFLKALSSQSVVLGQAFQHLMVPEAGQSWCITNHIRVPARLHNILVHEQFVTSACTIAVHRKSEAYFEGRACTLHELLDFWKSRTQETLTLLDETYDAPPELKECDAYFRNGSSANRFFKRVKQGIMMDYSEDYDYSEMSPEWPPDTAVLDDRAEPIIECRIPELTRAADLQQVIGEAIVAKNSDKKPSVLYLGRVKYIESMDVALIIIREGNARSALGEVKKGVWRRIGICFWNVEGGRIDELAKCLKPLKGRFG